MKSHLISLFAIVALTGVLAAQPVPTPVVSEGEAATSPAPAAPMENVTINFKGTLASGAQVDFAFTTSGPTFSMDQQLADIEVAGAKQAIFAHCQVTIVAIANGYRVQYSLYSQLPLVTSSSSTVNDRASTTASVTSSAASSKDAAVPVRRTPATVTYQSIGVTGSVILKSGQPVTILSADGKGLAMTLTKATP